MNKELREAQLRLGQPAQDPAWMIVKMDEHDELFWDGKSWNKNYWRAKLYPSRQAAYHEHGVPDYEIEVRQQ